MQALRSDVIRRLQQARGGFALGLLVAAASASTGCGQPRSFLDNTVMRQQSRDAEFYWGPDRFAGQAPLAHRSVGSLAHRGGELTAQADASRGASELFPATYRSVPLPQAEPGIAARRDATMVADAPAVEPMRESTLVSAPSAPRAEAPRVTEKTSKPATHVTARPRDDGLMLTSLADSEPLPPLPSERPQPEPQAPADADLGSLPPLPPALPAQQQPEAAPADDSDALPPLPEGMR